jgi:hypothetical protein
MDFLTDLKVIVRSHLSSVGVPCPEGASVDKLLLLAFNYELRTIRPVARIVHESNEFKSRSASLTLKQQKAAKEIIAKFARGEDVNAHLSRATPEKALRGFPWDFDLDRRASCFLQSP